MFFSETGTIEPGTLNAPAQFRPARTAPSGFVMNRISFFQLVFPRSGFAPGTYYVFAVLARIGAFADGRIDPGDIVSIDVHPITFIP